MTTLTPQKATLSSPSLYTGGVSSPDDGREQYTGSISGNNDPSPNTANYPAPSGNYSGYIGPAPSNPGSSPGSNGSTPSPGQPGYVAPNPGPSDADFAKYAGVFGGMPSSDLAGIAGAVGSANGTTV